MAYYGRILKLFTKMSLYSLLIVSQYFFALVLFNLTLKIHIIKYISHFHQNNLNSFTFYGLYWLLINGFKHQLKILFFLPLKENHTPSINLLNLI